MNYDDQAVAAITAGGFPFPKLRYETSEEKLKRVKLMAVHHVGRQLFDALDLMKITIFCPSETIIAEEELPFHMFLWSYNHFTHRRSYSDRTFGVITNALRTQSKSLEERKFYSDLKELLKYSKLILKCYLHPNDFKYFDLSDFLRGIQISTFSHEPLHDDFERNKSRCETYKKSIRLTQIAENEVHMQTEEAEEKFQLQLEDILMNALDCSYVSRHCATQKEEESMIWEESNNAIQNEIYDITAKIDSENNCFQTTINVLKGETEFLKIRIAKRLRLYDVDYEKVFNIGSYLKSQIEKMRTMRQFYEEELKRFAEELRDMKIKDEKRREEEEEKARQAELEALSRKRKRRRKVTNSTSKSAKR